MFLLVEDDEIDVELFQRSLRSHQIDTGVLIARDGEMALEILRKQIVGSGRDDMIVFLDLNMPGINGLEFLSELRSDSQLRRTIVFVLTSSDHQRDKMMAYDQNVAGYFSKSNIDSLMQMIKSYVQGVEYPPATASE